LQAADDPPNPNELWCLNVGAIANALLRNHIFKSSAEVGSNDRLFSIDDDKVRFRWKDYRNANRLGTMTLTAEEFIRRFLLHVLPAGFQRIRYYGFFCNRYREQKLARCRELLGMPMDPPSACEQSDDYRDNYEAVVGISLKQCPFAIMDT
jgi:hypothetical protein